MSETTDIKPTPSIKKLLDAQAELNKAQAKAKEEYEQTLKTEVTNAKLEFLHSLRKLAGMYNQLKDVSDATGRILGVSLYEDEQVHELLKAMGLMTVVSHQDKLAKAASKVVSAKPAKAVKAVKKKSRMTLEDKTKLITQVLEKDKELSTSELEKKTGINQINKDLTKLKGKVLTRHGKGGKAGYTWKLK